MSRLRVGMVGEIRCGVVSVARTVRQRCSLVAWGARAGVGVWVARTGHPGNARAAAANVLGDAGIMSDFLSSLAEQALGVASMVIEPRLPSLFEPAGEMAPEVQPQVIESAGAAARENMTEAAS